MSYTVKTVIVDLGTCDTCGKKVRAGVTEMSFITPYGITPYGDEEDVIRVEGHCGSGGHAMKVGMVAKSEFDTAENGAMI